jgi:hypothetical protein
MMKTPIFRTLVLVGSISFASVAQAELLTPVISLSPGSPTYSASAAFQVPNAWTYPGDPDIWRFDLSAFSSAVNVTVHVNDYYPPYPDDYNLYWDGSLLGNTLTATPGSTFSFSTSNAAHQLTVEYVNLYTGWVPSSGGSYYDLTVAAAPVPEPETFALMLAGLGLLGWMERRKKLK